jgi:hypothetical protein
LFLEEKEKRKMNQQYWATLAQAAQQHREKRSRACVRPRPRARARAPAPARPLDIMQKSPRINS